VDPFVGEPVQLGPVIGGDAPAERLSPETSQRRGVEAIEDDRVDPHALTLPHAGAARKTG
jgi:hypothetical protein